MEKHLQHSYLCRKLIINKVQSSCFPQNIGNRMQRGEDSPGMQSPGLASVRKSDSLSDCCISCLLKASRLLQSRVLKSALEVSGNLFAHQLFLMSIGGTRRPFCRRGTLGARGVGWALGVLRREGFIYLFSHRANKATRRVPACGPWGPP